MAAEPFCQAVDSPTASGETAGLGINAHLQA